MHIKSISLFVIFSCFLFTGCRKTVIDETAGCDCGGKPAEVVNDVSAQILASKGRYLSLKEAVGPGVGKLIFLCDTSMITGLPTSKNGDYDYVIGGNLRPPCLTNGVAYIWNVELTSIRKK